jgi:hypothetical protein
VKAVGAPDEQFHMIVVDNPLRFLAYVPIRDREKARPHFRFRCDPKSPAWEAGLFCGEKFLETLLSIYQPKIDNKLRKSIYILTLLILGATLFMKGKAGDG